MYYVCNYMFYDTCGVCHFWCRGLVSSYSSDIGIWVSGKRYVSKQNVNFCKFAHSWMSMYGQCMSSVASSPEPRLDLLHSSICTSRKETREDSHTQLRAIFLHGQFFYSYVVRKFSLGPQIKHVRKPHKLLTWMWAVPYW